MGDVRDDAEVQLGYVGEPVRNFRRRYKLGEELGSGNYATVYKATDKKKNEFAVKVIDKTKIPDLETLYKEVNIIVTLNHPNIIRCYGVYEDDENIYLVTGYAGGGELFDSILAKTHYSETDAKDVVRRIAFALRYCHSKGIIHRDLKPENILLLEEQGTEIVLADFGFATTVNRHAPDHKTMQTQLGTPNYLAPEIIDGRVYNFKCDVWALGVITYVLLSGNLPFGANDRYHLFKQVRTGRFNYEPAVIWRYISPDAKDFIDGLLTVDTDKRFNYDQIVHHKWLTTETGGDENLIETLKNIEVFQEKKKEMYKQVKARVALAMMKGLMDSKNDVKEETPKPEESACCTLQ